MVLFTEHLKEKLDDYVAKLPVLTRVLRTPQRGGLIRARLKGEYLFNEGRGGPRVESTIQNNLFR